ncbi:MAG: hypothetical protein HYZ26_13380 [Chloroflexi bacterium]|nr:hypothetical protein [Chloroflexota bacterium]
MMLAKIESSRSILSPIGEIVQDVWNALPAHFANVGVDEFVIMPNHVHEIVWIHEDEAFSTARVGATHAVVFDDALQKGDVGATHVVVFDDALQKGVVGAQHAAPLPKAARVASGSLGAIVRSFKSAATREVHRRGLNNDRPLWQRNYFEHVIRNEEDLFTHRRYIRENPLKWELDEYHA